MYAAEAAGIITSGISTTYDSRALKTVSPGLHQLNKIMHSSRDMRACRKGDGKEKCGTECRSEVVRWVISICMQGVSPEAVF